MVGERVGEPSREDSEIGTIGEASCGWAKHMVSALTQVFSFLIST
jgi:hypothetical protein